MKGNSLTAFLCAMLARRVVGNAAKVSLFVGTCLNLINQGPAIWRDHGVEWDKFALNFIVPYLVSSYSAAKVRKGSED